MYYKVCLNQLSYPAPLLAKKIQLTDSVMVMVNSAHRADVRDFTYGRDASIIPPGKL